MIKFINFIILIPLIFNLIIILIIIIPSKINNFHPISFLIILILLTLIICLKINFIYKSWIPFILFLIIIGGLIVIFIYITRLANNNFFNFNLKLLIINIIKILPIILLLISLIILFKLLIFNFHFESFNLNNFIILKNQINLNIIYKELNNKSSYFIILYLYYSIICIINICYKFKAPLRQILF